MTVGLPDRATIETYGGPLDNATAVEDPTTDEDKTKTNVMKMDVAGMGNTACRAWYRFIGNAVTPTEPASNVHQAIWGNDPSVKPSATHVSTGIYDITWESTVTDTLGVDHAVSFAGALRPNVEGSTLYHAQATVTAANVIRVYIFNSAGALNDAVGVTILVAGL